MRRPIFFLLLLACLLSALLLDTVVAQEEQDEEEDEAIEEDEDEDDEDDEDEVIEEGEIDPELLDPQLMDPDCVNGSCPNNIKSDQEEPSYDCGMWLGPSPIKQAEQHGFGLGMFTGKNIKEGEVVGSPEVLIPIYDNSLDSWPPLREYIWDQDNLPEMTMQSKGDSWVFIPGLAGIAACTSNNFNLVMRKRLQQGTSNDDATTQMDEFMDRTTNPMAGAYSYRSNVVYEAVRNIVAGEELTVQCSDDDYDGGAYYLSKFHHDAARTCVDDNLHVGKSKLILGRGLFAKHLLKQGEVVISSPVVPIHRKELQMEHGRQQLALNYCYGHQESNVLLLPFGPLVNYINYAPNRANVEIRWHSAQDDHDELHPRQQHHHAELLKMNGDEVAELHGKGLVVDFVALRDIEEGEEIYVDYGSAWQEAYDRHVKAWGRHPSYTSAATYMREHHDADVIRTLDEQESHPYPDNVQTACFYDNDAPELEQEELGEEDDDPNVVYTSWITEFPHECIRPCIILNRYRDEDGKDLYRAKMLPVEKEEVADLCILEKTHVSRDVPRRGIRLVDRPYTTDEFLLDAFRHELGVPDGFYPDVWLKKKVRRSRSQLKDHDGDAFKRKIPQVGPMKKQPSA